MQKMPFLSRSITLLTNSYRNFLGQVIFGNSSKHNQWSHNLMVCFASLHLWLLIHLFSMDEIELLEFGSSHFKIYVIDCYTILLFNNALSGLHLVIWNSNKSSVSNLFHSTDITAAFSKHMTGNNLCPKLLWHFQRRQIYPVWLSMEST